MTKNNSSAGWYTCINILTGGIDGRSYDKQNDQIIIQPDKYTKFIINKNLEVKYQNETESFYIQPLQDYDDVYRFVDKIETENYDYQIIHRIEFIKLHNRTSQYAAYYQTVKPKGK